ncbi:MAG TPA: oligosaccharide flippase family protein, partial [Candidatus Acidoferrum sp.]|nr:oligosaccharide flippase family protein [Candidatus Acidoferrum sp.]
MSRLAALLLRHFRALKRDSLLLNSFFLFLSTATMAGFGFIFWLLVAHFYPPSLVGVASTLISAMNFIAYLALLGFDTTFIKFLPGSQRRSEQIDTGLLLVGGAALLAATGYAFIAPRLAPGLHVLSDHWYFMVGYVFLVTGAAVNLVTDSIFIAYRSAKYNFFIDGLTASSLQVVLPMALVGLGAYGVFAASGAAAFIAMLVSIVVLMRRFGYQPRLAINRTILREVARYSFINYIANLLNVVPTLVLPLIIINKLGTAAAGYYYLAFMMATLLYTIAHTLSQAMLAEGSYDEAALKPL